MRVMEFQRVGEKVIHERLENGLDLFVIPKAGFSKTYAFFATNYGSVDMRFSQNGGWTDTPAGVAHFLEHKMFDTPDGNALQELSKNGASPNAFTSFSMTAYYFDCTEKFTDSLRILLDFVSVPYFTEDSVSKEQGIIAQEIRMYDDNPEWRVLEAMFDKMYASHPIRIPIAGTIQSISEITADTLYQCHKAFYNPANMSLCVVGDVEPEQIVQIAREVLPKTAGAEVERDYGVEAGSGAVGHDVVTKMEVPSPMFSLGFKHSTPAFGEEYLRRELLAELSAAALFGNSTELYSKLYSQGLINRTYDTGYYSFSGGGCLLVSGESRDPSAVRDAILQEAERVAKEGLDEALFERLKKAAVGARLTALNYPSAISRNVAASHFGKAEYFSFPEIYDSFDVNDVVRHINENVRHETSTLSIVM